MIQYTGLLVRSMLAVSAGGAAVVGGSYLISKYRNVQEKEDRIARLEQMVEQLVELEKKSSSAKRPAKTTAKTTAKRSTSSRSRAKTTTKSDSKQENE